MFFLFLAIQGTEPSIAPPISYLPSPYFVRISLACQGWPQICGPPSSASPVPGITGLWHHAPLNSHFNDKCQEDGKDFIPNSKRRATCSQVSEGLPYKLCFSSISKHFKVLFLIESFWLYYLKVALLLSPAHLPHSQKCPWEAVHVRVKKVWASRFPHLPCTACGLGQIPRHLWAPVSSFKTWEQDQVYTMFQG